MTTLNKIREILTSSHKKELIILLLLLILGIIMEMAGIGLLLPAINFFLNPDTFEKYKKFIPIIFSSMQRREIILLFFTGLIFFYIIKSIFLIYLSYRQSNFTANLSNYLSNKLFQGYIEMPYSFHLNNNTSELIKNIQSEVLYFGGICLASMAVATELSAIFGISLLLIIVEPYGTLTVLLFFSIFAFVFNRFTNTKMKILGSKREKTDQLAYKQLIEGLSGTKEIKIFLAEKYFFDKFKILNKNKSNIHTKVQVYGNIPRLYLELLTVIGVSVLIIVINIQGNSNNNQLIPILGIFIAAAFRLLPSVNKIMNSLQVISFANPVINVLHRELLKIKSNKIEKLRTREINNNKTKFNETIIFKDISYKYENTDKFVLENINLEIKKGDLVGIIGKTGSGKSTLINLLIGLLEPVHGMILVDNVSIFSDTTSWKKCIGYVPQNIYLLDESIKNNIAFGIEEELIDLNKVNDAIKLSQLENYVSNLENGIETIVGERGVKISGGERQRIGIARALYHNPPVLILDEATSSLDVNTESEFMKSVNNLHRLKTIIIVAHRLSTIEKCDVVYQVNNGKISLK